MDEHIIEEGLEAGIEAFLGETYTTDPHNGCCWAATGIASYYSEFAARQFDAGIVYVPTLVENAEAEGLVEPFAGTFEKGDILVYGDNDHVVVAIGGDEYVGNSSIRGCVVHGLDCHCMGGLEITKVIKTSMA